jgi:hypothetical protein
MATDNDRFIEDDLRRRFAQILELVEPGSDLDRMLPAASVDGVRDGEADQRAAATDRASSTLSDRSVQRSTAARSRVLPATRRRQSKRSTDLIPGCRSRRDD